MPLGIIVQRCYEYNLVLLAPENNAIKQVHRFPRAVYKSFLTRMEAEDWIARQEAVYAGPSILGDVNGHGDQPVALPSGEFGDDFIRLEADEAKNVLTTGGAISHSMCMFRYPRS